MTIYKANLYDILAINGVDLEEGDIDRKERLGSHEEIYTFSEPSRKIRGNIEYIRTEQAEEQPFRDLNVRVRTFYGSEAELLESSYLDDVTRITDIAREFIEEGYVAMGIQEALAGYDFVGGPEKDEDPIENIEGVKEETEKALAILRGNLKDGTI